MTPSKKPGLKPYWQHTDGDLYTINSDKLPPPSQEFTVDSLEVEMVGADYMAWLYQLGRNGEAVGVCGIRFLPNVAKLWAADTALEEMERQGMFRQAEIPAPTGLDRVPPALTRKFISNLVVWVASPNHAIVDTYFFEPLSDGRRKQMRAKQYLPEVSPQVRLSFTIGMFATFRAMLVSAA